VAVVNMVKLTPSVLIVDRTISDTEKRGDAEKSKVFFFFTLDVHVCKHVVGYLQNKIRSLNKWHNRGTLNISSTIKE